ncbi:MAG: hypothetical protein ACF8XB_01155 [Planctomycetota bacterium JB042]
MTLSLVECRDGVKDCRHDGQFVVDERLSEVTCNTCGERLNAMWVLIQLSRKESRLDQLRRRIKAERDALEKRSWFKCPKCSARVRCRPKVPWDVSDVRPMPVEWAPREACSSDEDDQ